jgi:hypothetical protein
LVQDPLLVGVFEDEPFRRRYTMVHPVTISRVAF